MRESQLKNLKLEQEKSQTEFFDSYKRLNDDLLMNTRDAVSSWYAKYSDKNMNEVVPVDIPMVDKLLLMCAGYGLTALTKRLKKIRSQHGIRVKDMLRMRLDVICAISYGERLIALERFLKSSYEDSYDAMMYLSQRSSGMAWMYELPEIDFSKAWAMDGLTYSERLSSKMFTFTDEVMMLVLSGMAAQWGLTLIDSYIEKKYSTAGYSNKVLVMEESTHFIELAKLQCQESVFDRYRYSAILDAVTTQICRGLNGRIFTFSEAEQGVNYPPMHRFCRSFAVPIDHAIIPDGAVEFASDLSREQFIATYKR